MAGTAGCRLNAPCRGRYSRTGDCCDAHRVSRSVSCMVHRARSEHFDACFSHGWIQTIGDCCAATPMDCASRHSAPTDIKGVGTRERLLNVAARHPDRLRIELNALATRVLFDADNRAIGVEYLKGDRLYRAHPSASEHPGERRVVHAGREVVLAGGAFNTPQLLMLSGIGPRADAGAAMVSRSDWNCPASVATCRIATRSAW